MGEGEHQVIAQLIDPLRQFPGELFVGCGQRQFRAGVDEIAHRRFDTPSLRFVSGTAPYFHDGRYPTLRALLVGSDGKMGHTAKLSPHELDALEAYLRTL